jgi:mRNA-degrading endonuclease RelE of RelBE toxin-antitoxin system
VRYAILLSPEAIQDHRRLPRHLRTEIRDAIELHLRHEPTKVSRSRIKRLRGVDRPQYRLRVGDIRVFYDVHGQDVEVLAIVSKSDAARWLEEVGKRK